MSHLRNRHRSLSQSSRRSDKHSPNPQLKKSLGRTTTRSFYIPQQQSSINYDLHQADQVFHKNISFFRDNFNQTDRSQLPFMSSLREPQQFRSKSLKTTTICVPFQASLKQTSNQLTKKNVSDFSAKQKRLSTAFYRWHNKSGKNNKWSTNFQCSLRDYGGNSISPKKQFYSFIKPITYNDIEPLIYQKSDMICSRHKRSFKVC